MDRPAPTAVQGSEMTTKMTPPGSPAMLTEFFHQLVRGQHVQALLRLQEYLGKLPEDFNIFQLNASQRAAGEALDRVFGAKLCSYDAYHGTIRLANHVVGGGKPEGALYDEMKEVLGRLQTHGYADFLESVGTYFEMPLLDQEEVLKAAAALRACLGPA